MNKNTEVLPSIKLVGIVARTSNRQEQDPSTAQIGAVMQKFFMQDLQSKIPNRKNPGRVFSAYTQYESDEQGEYTYFLGEEVQDFENIPSDFQTLTIPAQKYTKFTSEPGVMPNVVIELWQSIWKMDESLLGGNRAYVTDFEIYDERSQDPNRAVLDIYVGIKS